jgi:hypothetical protein
MKSTGMARSMLATMSSNTALSAAKEETSAVLPASGPPSSKGAQQSKTAQVTMSPAQLVKLRHQAHAGIPP